MSNLVEVAEELEYVPKEQLIQMAQEPNSRFPSYMVLSEIQRRTQMERMYNAARTEKPTTTVAEELVGEFSQPQGLAGMAADGLVPLANNFSPSAPPAPQLQMAGGGFIDKWFGNKYLNPFVSDQGTADWKNPVSAIPHVAYQNAVVTGDPMGEGVPVEAPWIKDINEGFGIHDPDLVYDWDKWSAEKEERRKKELAKLYAENPEASLGLSGMSAGGGRTGYADTGSTKQFNNIEEILVSGKDQGDQLKLISQLKERQRKEFAPVTKERKRDLYKSSIDFMYNKGHGLWMPHPGDSDSAVGGAYKDIEYDPAMSDKQFREVKESMYDTLLSQYFPKEHKAKWDELERLSNIQAIKGRQLRGPSQEEIDMMAGRQPNIKRIQPEKKGIGGRVGYQNLGSTSVGSDEIYYQDRRKMLASLGIDSTGMSDEEIEQALIFQAPEEQKLQKLQEIDTGVGRPVDLATEEPGFFEGLYDDASESYLGQLAKDYAKETYYDDEGDFKYGAAALDAATFIPGLGLAGSLGIKGLVRGYQALRGINYADAGRKGLQAVDKVTKPFYTSPRQVVKSKKGIEYPVTSPEGQMIKNIGGGKAYGSKTQRDFSLNRALGTSAVGGLAAREVYDYMQSDAKATEDAGTEPRKEDLDNKIKEIVPDDKINKGLKGKVNSYIKQADGLDIAKLGGIIMGARDMSELGAGIAGLASDIQERRLTEKELENRESFQGLQGALVEAQTAQTEAEIDAMPAEQVNDLLTQYAAYAKAINNQDINLDEEGLRQFGIAYQLLIDKANKLQGIETVSKADQFRAVLDETRI